MSSGDPGPVNVHLARVYDPVYDPADDHPAQRVLVDRLWPRGIAKADAPFDRWLKDVAPSTALRRWYGHDPDRFDEFARRYRDELRTGPAEDALGTLRAHTRSGSVVLVTATRDVDLSAAKVLLDVLTSTP